MGKSRRKVLLWLRFCEPISTSSSALGQKYYQISQYYFYHSLWPLLHLPCLIVVEASSNSPSFVLTQTDGLPLIQEMHFLEKKVDKALHQFSAAGILPSFPATVASRKKYPRPNMDKRGRGTGPHGHSKTVTMPSIECSHQERRGVSRGFAPRIEPQHYDKSIPTNGLLPRSFLLLNKVSVNI